jgi:hypothetical protein
MDGKVLINAFEPTAQPAFIESWDAVAGDAGLHTDAEHYDPTEAAESLKQLVALGYVAPPQADARDAVTDCLREQRYNLARAHIDAGRPDLGAAILRELIEEDREQARFYLVLSACYLLMGDFNAYRRLIAAFDKACSEFSPRAREELKRRRAEQSDGELAQTARGKPKDEAAARRESFERRQLAEKANGHVTERILLRCRLLLSRGRSAQQKKAARSLLEELGKLRNAQIPLRLFLCARAETARSGAPRRP